MGRKPAKKRRALRRGDGFINERPLKDGTIRYQARWSEPDRSGDVVWRSRTFSTQEDAEKHLRSIGEDKREDRFVPESRLTVKDAVAAYIKRASALGRWKSNTTATNTIIAERLIYPRIGELRVSRLRYPQVQTWVDGVLLDGKSVSITRNALSLLGATMNELVRMDVLVASPIQHIEIGPRTQKPVRTWTMAESKRLLAATMSDARQHAIFTLAISTGMRPGELRALKWEDIDLERGRMRVRRTITKNENQKEIVGTSTKTGRERIVLLNGPSIAALTRWRTKQDRIRENHPLWRADDIVFDRGDGRFTPGSTWQRQHRAAVKNASIDHIRPHAMRHTAATLMMEQQTGYKVVGEILGHKSASMTLDVYSHVSEEMQQTAAERMAQQLFGVTPDATTSGDDTTTSDVEKPNTDDSHA